MTRAGVAAALRNYVSLVVVRDNPQAFTASYATLCCYLFAAMDRRRVALHGIRSLFAGESNLTLWWLAACFLPMALMTQYWRQVRSTLAPAIPALVEAEFCAICLVLVAALAALGAPFILLGAPVAGTLALVASGMLVGGGAVATAPTGQRGLARSWQTAIFIPLMLLGFVPGMMARLVFAPWPLGCAVLVLALCALFAGLRFYPARAAVQTEAMQARGDRAPSPPSLARGLPALLAWRPRFMPAAPLPSNFGLLLGPFGALLASFLQISALVLVLCILASLQGEGWRTALRHSGPMAVGQGIAFGVITAGQWLMNRGEWPVLFAAGRFGSRRSFARHIFRAHAVNTAQRALCDALVGTVFAAALGAVHGVHVAALALIIFGLVFGASYAASVPLLWREFGGKGLAVGLRMAAVLLIMTVLTFGVMQHGITPLAGLAAAAVFLFGLAMAWLGPQRLAAMDWPFEAEPLAV